MLSDWHENTKGKYGLTTEQAYLVTTETYTGMVGTDGSIKWNKLVYTGADVKVDVTGVGFDADIINKAGTETYLTLVGYAKSLKGVK